MHFEAVVHFVKLYLPAQWYRRTLRTCIVHRVTQWPSIQLLCRCVHWGCRHASERRCHRPGCSDCVCLKRRGVQHMCVAGGGRGFWIGIHSHGSTVQFTFRYWSSYTHTHTHISHTHTSHTHTHHTLTCDNVILRDGKWVNGSVLGLRLVEEGKAFTCLPNVYLVEWAAKQPVLEHKSSKHIQPHITPNVHRRTHIHQSGFQRSLVYWSHLT